MRLRRGPRVLLRGGRLRRRHERLGRRERGAVGARVALRRLPPQEPLLQGRTRLQGWWSDKFMSCKHKGCRALKLMVELPLQEVLSAHHPGRHRRQDEHRRRQHWPVRRGLDGRVQGVLLQVIHVTITPLTGNLENSN